MNKRLTYRTTARKTLMAFDGPKCAQLPDLAAKVGRSKSAVCRAPEEAGRRWARGAPAARPEPGQSASLFGPRVGERLASVWSNRRYRPRLKTRSRSHPSMRCGTEPESSLKP